MHAVHPCTAILTLPKVPSLPSWNFGNVRLWLLVTYTNLSLSKSLPAPQTWQSTKGARGLGRARRQIPIEAMEFLSVSAPRTPASPGKGRKFFRPKCDFGTGPNGCAGPGELRAGIPRLSLCHGGRFCNSLMLLGMSTSDTVTSWQKGRGKGGNERRGWMIQDVLLCICVLSSVCLHPYLVMGAH